MPLSARAPKVVFDQLRISRISIDLSLRTGRTSGVGQAIQALGGGAHAHAHAHARAHAHAAEGAAASSASQKLADLLISMVAAVVLNVDGLHLRLPQCRFNAHLSSHEHLAARLLSFYVNSALISLPKLLGSLDLLGGPIERLREVGVGLRQATYRPAAYLPSLVTFPATGGPIDPLPTCRLRLPRPL